MGGEGDVLKGAVTSCRAPNPRVMHKRMGGGWQASDFMPRAWTRHDGNGDIDIMSMKGKQRCAKGSGDIMSQGVPMASPHQLMVITCCQLIVITHCQLIVITRCQLMVITHCQLMIITRCQLIVITCCQLMVITHCQLMVITHCGFITVSYSNYSLLLCDIYLQLSFTEIRSLAVLLTMIKRQIYNLYSNIINMSY